MYLTSLNVYRLEGIWRHTKDCFWWLLGVQAIRFQATSRSEHWPCSHRSLEGYFLHLHKLVSFFKSWLLIAFHMNKLDEAQMSNNLGFLHRMFFIVISNIYCICYFSWKNVISFFEFSKNDNYPGFKPSTVCR